MCSKPFRSCCAALVLLVQMFFSPLAVLCVIPPAVAVLYAGGALGLNQLFKRRSPICVRTITERRPGKRRFARSSPVSRLWDVGFWRARWPPIRPNIAAQLYVSAVEQAVCVGISMGVNSLLLAVLVHYLLVLRMHPNDDDNPSRELLRLRKELRVPHCI